jgi:hypothetical protein
VMRAAGNRDFAALLDELIASSLAENEAPSQPAIPFDYLSVAEELHSGRIRVSPDAVAAEYREADAMADALFAAAQAAEQEEEKLPSTEPEAIWKELDLAHVTEADELGRRRRVFAFRNHPDRVEPHLRQRAMVRMQVANMLIDEMERRMKRGAR